MEVVTYAHQNNPNGVRYRQLAKDPLPEWAVNVQQEQFKLIVVYNPDTGTVLPDNKVQDYVDSWIETAALLGSHTVQVGSELIVCGIRAAVAQKKIKPDQVEVWFNGRQLQLNEHGRFVDGWPIDYPDIMTDFLRLIL